MTAQIEAKTPDGLRIESVTFEGPKLVIYTPDVGTFERRDGLVPKLASTLLKRIAVRPTQDALVPSAEAREEILHLG